MAIRAAPATARRARPAGRAGRRRPRSRAARAAPPARCPAKASAGAWRVCRSERRTFARVLANLQRRPVWRPLGQLDPSPPVPTDRQPAEERTRAAPGSRDETWTEKADPPRSTAPSATPRSRCHSLRPPKPCRQARPDHALTRTRSPIGDRSGHRLAIVVELSSSPTGQAPGRHMRPVMLSRGFGRNRRPSWARFSGRKKDGTKSRRIPEMPHRARKCPARLPGGFGHD